MLHVELADMADMLVVAPLTANTMAKIAHVSQSYYINIQHQAAEERVKSTYILGL